MAIALSMTTSHAVIHSGSLGSPGALLLDGTTPDGTLFGTEEWQTGATFTWSASNEESGCDSWYYTYTLRVLGKDISHATTEVSSTFEASNLLGDINDPGNILSDGSLDLYGPGLHGSSDPSIPDNMYGIKVDTTGDTKIITWSLCSNRVPVWGDMYAKDGKSKGADVYLYNTGFTANDVDPTDPASSGSVNNHILVPNSIGDDPEGPGIPEPSTAVLGAVGLLLILRRRMI